MEEVAFSDWPGQPVDLNSGNNPWMPAYGFQTPSALLDREDFIGNPDAEYFLHDHAGQYAYLETILEETSEDLRSEESDFDSRGSPVGWLATDSEAGSVICIDAPDDVECESDREIACPAKRRKHDFFLAPPNPEEDLSSLSRSSSLLQFESLEKQCQETCNSSPSVYSQYSFDSLENPAGAEDETGYYETLKIDVPRRRETSRDSLLYNASRYSGSESSDSDATLDTSRSMDNLKAWRSCDSLPQNGKGFKEKASVENLSEDSGYSDHLTKSSSAHNLKEKIVFDWGAMKSFPEKRSSCAGFSAYDGEFVQDNFSGNFGVSYRDLTSFKDDQLDSPSINSNKHRSHLADDISDALKLDARQECDRRSNFKTSTSLPDLLQTSKDRTACVTSVPKDLNFIGEFTQSANSAAAKDWNLADLRFDYETVLEADKMSYYKREGSYSEAMSNRVDLSDDEHSLYNKRKPKLPKTPIVEFDKRVLKAISEQSLQSILSSSQNLPQNEIYLDEAYSSTPKSSKQQRYVASTPNLALAEQKYFDEERRRSVHDVRRKGSIIKSSTSTSGMSDAEEKTLSLSGSANSKGVHFSPVVSELNWRDDSVSTVTPDRESSYSLGSSSPERRQSPPKEIVKPKARFPTPSRLSCSQPDLSDNDSCRREFVDSLKSLREDTMSKSQPDVNKLRRRGSQLIKKDKDGSVIKAYVDGDGIRYQHTHLDIGIGFGPHRAPAAAGEPGAERAARPVDAMHAHGAFAGERARKPGKIDRFFARLAGLRFGLKRGAEGKGKKKANRGDAGPAPNAYEQRVATKDDYIYIPLKGPPARDEEDPTRRQHVTAKPPLPRQPPPRVVHASVKAQAGVESSGRSQRRRTIDGPAASGEAAASMEPPLGLIETDLDTEVTVITTGGRHAKTRSLLDLARPPARHRPAPAAGLQADDGDRRPHKSMEFLLDKQNLRVVEPPENELQKGERVMSEHQLRVQRSLQKLTIPDWYKPSQVPREGFLLKKHQPSPSRDSRWTGTGSRTTSLSSLGSAHNPPPLSPTPSNQPFVRWSTSKLNSTASSPCASTRSSFNARQPNGSPSSARSSFSYRQPYLGWRSQERLGRPRTPAERLASSLLASQGSPEIQTSIKEVTSAIVHYVSGLRPDDQEATSQRSGSASPRGSQKFCWLESSFVGARPPEAPQTPTDGEGRAPARLRLDLQNHNGKSVTAS